jgi:hypothetical protein
VAIVMAATHGTVDAYMGFLHPLLPRIMDKLGLSITLAASSSRPPGIWRIGTAAGSSSPQGRSLPACSPR